MFCDSLRNNQVADLLGRGPRERSGMLGPFSGGGG